MIQPQNGQWLSARGRVLVVTPGTIPTNLFSGQRVEITGVLAPPPGAEAEGLFDYRAYLRRQCVYYQLKTESTEDWQPLAPLRRAPVSDQFLAWAKATLARGLPGQDEPLQLLWAMTLGWKTGLTSEIYEPFMRSGTMHIFAISGLHIALICGILVSLLRVLQVQRTWCGGIVVPLIWFYTAATGWQPSAIRSAVMMTIVIGGWALRRPGDLLNSLAAAAFIILVWDPQQLFGASFQLSFFVVLSIALLVPPVERARERLLKTDPLVPDSLVPPGKRWGLAALRWASGSAATSVAAWLGSLPLTAYYFHLFSPITFFANLCIVPLSSLALACNLGSLACGAWCSWATELFNHSAWGWMALMVKLSDWAVAVPGAFLFVRAPSALDFFTYYGILLAALSGWLFLPKRRVVAMALLCGLACAHAVEWQGLRRTATLSVIPLDGGMSVFFRGGACGTDLLVDCGATNAARRTALPFLRAQGVNRLRGFALSHGDLRHVGGARLVRQEFSPQEIGFSPLRFRSTTYRQIVEEFSQSPENVRHLSRGGTLGAWTVMHPAADDKFSQADDAALVLRGEFFGTSVLLLSDLGRAGQTALIDRTPDLRAEIVVTGLPSQGEALSDSFLDVVQPTLLVVADSEFPATERARAQLRARLARRQIPVVYTGSEGAVTLEFRRGHWSVRAVRGWRWSSGSAGAPAARARPH
jgi:ComEC/Rec2-related protein